MLTKERSWIYSACIVGVALVVLGFSIQSGISSLSSNRRVVSVKGLAEREVIADQVIWPITYKASDNDLLNLYNTIEQQNKVISDFLIKNGIKQSEISISAPMVNDTEADFYGAQRPKYRYMATSIITVSSTQVEQVRTIMSQQAVLLKQGVAVLQGYYGSTQFLFNGLNTIKPEMVQEATKNARMTAEKFASDSDSKLGKIKQANQGVFTITDRDSNTPHIKVVRVVTSVDYFLKD